jgi:NTE family protein
LVLGSGGARGLSHIGVIKKLEKEGLQPDIIIGTSMGALVGAYYALHGEVHDLERLAVSINNTDVLRMVDVNNITKSFIKGDKIKRFLKDLFQDKSFEDTKIRLVLAATSLQDGTQVVIESGKLADAVMASANLPVMMQPVKYQGKNLVDGGLVDSTPVKLAFDYGADSVIAVDLFNARKVDAKDFSMFMQLERVYDIMCANSVKFDEKDFDKLIVLRPETGSRLQTFAFTKARTFIKAGEAEAADKMHKIKDMLR